MPDNKTKTRPQDAKRINVNEYFELRNWAKKFGVSHEQVKAAVKTVGTSAGAVGMHPRKDHPIQGRIPASLSGPPLMVPSAERGRIIAVGPFPAE